MNWFTLLFVALVVSVLADPARARKGKEKRKHDRERNISCNQTAITSNACPAKQQLFQEVGRRRQNVKKFLHNTITRGLEPTLEYLEILTESLEKGEYLQPEGCNKDLNPTKKDGKKMFSKTNRKKKFRVLAESTWLMTSIEASLSVISELDGVRKDNFSKAPLMHVRQARGFLQELAGFVNMNMERDMCCQVRDPSEFQGLTDTDILNRAYLTARDAKDAVGRIIRALKTCDVKQRKKGAELRCKGRVFQGRRGRDGSCLRKRPRKKGGKKGKKSQKKRGRKSQRKSKGTKSRRS